MRVEAAALAALLALASCAPSRGDPELSRSDFVIGTVCTIRIAGGPRGAAAQRALDGCFERLRAIEGEMSANKEGTALAAINDAAGGGPVAAPADLRYVLSKALDYARLSAGAFDPSVGPLVKLWGIGTDAARLPSAREIETARRLVDWRGVELDEAAGTVRLARAGMRLDLGAIAKGYAADEVAGILRAAGVEAAIVDLGGNIFALGGRAGGKAWRVGVQVPDPAAERGDYLGVVEGRDVSVVTSGVYERYFEKDGRRYHHILDVATGAPVDNGLLSVTIVAPRSVDADGLSTSLFALGRERGMALAATLPGVAAIMVDASKRVYLSPGAGRVFTLTSKDYALAD